MFKDFKDKKQTTIDVKIFGDNGKYELRKDSEDHLITEEELKELIIKLLALK